MTKLLLITIDSLRADSVNEQNFPRMYEEVSSNYISPEVCYSHGVATPFSFPGLMAGHEPVGNGTLKDSAVTLAEIADSAAGYPNNPHLNSSRGYTRGFDYFHSETSSVPLWKRIGGAIPGAKRVADLLGVTSDNGDDGRELGYDIAQNITDWVIHNLGDYNFIWAHYMDPHFPFINSASPTLDDIPVDSDIINDANDSYINYESDPNELELLNKLYEYNIRYLDLQLVRLVRRIKNKKLYEELNVVITADHGEAFGEKNVQNHDWGAKPIDELVKVPLFMKTGSDNWSVNQVKFTCHIQAYDSLSKLLSAGTSTDEELLESMPQYIISKSNGYIRVTDENGQAFRSRGGLLYNESSVSEKSMEILKNSPFPNIETVSGNILGKSDRQTEEQLGALGYK